MSTLRLSTLGAAFALAACTSTEPTEIVAGMSTQIQVPEYLKMVGLVVQAGGRVQFCNSYTVADGTVNLPATLGVLDRSNRAPVTVQVLGFRQEQSRFADDCLFVQDADDAEVMVVRRRRLTFVDDRILFLPMPLKESCNDTACSEDETCVAGACVPSDIDSATLPDYKDELIFGDTNTCFDAARCLDAARAPVLLEDPASCSFRAQWPSGAPMPEPGELNVRLFYDTFGSEILDLDRAGSDVNEQEGFSIVDEADPLAFRLAPNLCATNYQRDKVLGLEASALCAPKRALQPLCTGYEAPDTRATEDDPNPSGPRLCTIGGLRAVESAVYVLMDRSQSMFKFYGDGGLRFAVELPLSNPVARRTRVAFGQLPAAPEQCGTNDYANPTIPFGDVGDVRQPIGDILAASSSVLPDDPPLYLDAAMQGAYSALSALSTGGDSGFNRKALVVISNHDLARDRCPGQTAAERAAAALAQADSIVTYAVALDSGDAEAVSSATEIATAGGTTVFDGVEDEAQGARAVQDILTDLGSCLYEVVPDNTTNAQSAQDLPDDASISYLHPLTRVQIDIPRNTQCADGVSASGWNREGDRVRLCGAACTELRESLSDVALLHAGSQHIAPAVPLVVTAACPP